MLCGSELRNVDQPDEYCDQNKNSQRNDPDHFGFL
jgi:hypothetical protein